MGSQCLVMRQETERPEAVEAGNVRVVGTDTKDILREADLLLADSDAYRRMSQVVSPYGDGHAAERIVRILLDLS